MPTYRESYEDESVLEPFNPEIPTYGCAEIFALREYVTDRAGSDLLGAVRTRHDDVVGAFAADLDRACERNGLLT